MDASNLHLLLDNAALLIASTIFYQVSTYIKETYDQIGRASCRERV